MNRTRIRRTIPSTCRTWRPSLSPYDMDDTALTLAALAAKHPARVTYVDAGKAVEGPAQSFVSTLPCLFFEPCTGPTIAGVDQRGPFTRWGSLLSEPDRQRRGRRSGL